MKTESSDINETLQAIISLTAQELQTEIALLREQKKLLAHALSACCDFFENLQRKNMVKTESLAELIDNFKGVLEKSK